MGIFFRDDNDNDDDEYTGQTGDPLHDAIYGWDMGSSSSSDYNDSAETNYGNVGHTIQVTKRDEYSKKAWDYCMDNKNEDALYYINLALDLDNRHANNWNIKAIILDHMGRYGEAEQCYDKAISLHPNDLVYSNKAGMLRAWAGSLIEKSEKSPNRLSTLEEALEKNRHAINTLPKNKSKNPFLSQKRVIESKIKYEKEYQKKAETLKTYSKDELFTITGRNHYNNICLEAGAPLRLVKEPDNQYDKDAIAVYFNNEKAGYVANNPYTKYELTSSASELQDKIQFTTKGQYLVCLSSEYSNFHIGRIIKYNSLENSDSDDTIKQNPSEDSDSTRGMGMRRFKHIGRISDVKIEDNENNDILVGLEILDKMNELSEENQKLKKVAYKHGGMVGQFDRRFGRLYKENGKLKQLIIGGADKNESAKDILKIAEKLELIKRR